MHIYYLAVVFRSRGNMAQFSDMELEKRFAQLTGSRDSIKALSGWLMNNSLNAAVIVDTWMMQLRVASDEKKLNMFYVANDVLHFAMKKSPLFNHYFRLVMVDGYQEATKNADDKTKHQFKRILKIWQEKKIFEKEFVSKIVGDGENLECVDIQKRKGAIKRQRPADDNKAAQAETDGHLPEKRKKVGGSEVYEKALLELQQATDIYLSSRIAVPANTNTTEREKLSGSVEEVEFFKNLNACIAVYKLPPQLGENSMLSVSRRRSMKRSYRKM